MEKVASKRGVGVLLPSDNWTTNQNLSFFLFFIFYLHSTILLDMSVANAVSDTANCLNFTHTPVLQTVKDIVLELVDDNDVLSDKIGVTTFYWSFPSEAVNKVLLQSPNTSSFP